jgi:hypothetical protein
MAKETVMKFNPKFPTFRARIVTLAILLAVYGAAILLSGRDPYHHGRISIMFSAIVALAAIPREPKKVAPDKYNLTR